MSYGISKRSMELIINAFMKQREIDRASIFGSRSMGNYKSGSDVDIAIYGTNISIEIVNKINIELNEKLPLPYYFDIVHYDSLEHAGLKKHIDEFGKVFYSSMDKT
ncbi:MAG TPA: nucleotidyltransferase domain-containing protein [Tissierellales bacterium]|nr:nucleotidyltransferase domain-containing protein [Tissierellales bacterium]